MSSMANITDGKYCAERSKGCAMVQLGAYLAEPPEYKKDTWFLPPDSKSCVSFFKEELKHLKGMNVMSCLNLASPNLQWGLEAARCFEKAGGDIIELNAHGNYKPYLKRGKLRAMVLPENRAELYRWIEAFTKLDIPFIIKFRAGVIEDYSIILDRILEYDLFGVHFNVADEGRKEPDVEFVSKMKRESYFLLISGYIRTNEDIRKMFEAGADMVGVARPTTENELFIQEITVAK